MNENMDHLFVRCDFMTKFDRYQTS